MHNVETLTVSHAGRSFYAFILKNRGLGKGEKTDHPMSNLRERPTGRHTIKELAAEVARIYERAQSETLELIQARHAEKIDTPSREWMSAIQLAECWQLYNWSKRPQDQFPLHTLTWVISCDSIVTMLICGRGKRRKGDSRESNRVRRRPAPLVTLTGNDPR